MENLYFNLSKDEFSKSKKVLLWSFSGLFFLAGMYVIVASVVLGKNSINPTLALPPLAISIAVAAIASLATFKGSDLFFLIDDNKIEFKYGIFRPKNHLLMWNDIREIAMPARQRKAKLFFKDGSSFIINFTWIEGRKAAIIKKHIYHAAKEKLLNVQRVKLL
jgi:hypothetical protein